MPLARRVAGAGTTQAVQLGLEYDLQPPYDAGATDTAPAEIVAALSARSRFILTGQP